MITLSQNSGMAGRFMLEMHTAAPDGSEIPGSRSVVAPWQDNLITDSGLDNMAEANFMARCRIGSGNAAPSPGDTQLVSQLAEVSGSVANGPTGDDFVSIVGTYVFGQGVGTGIVAEIGVSPNTGNITTRALIRDENGDPTTIVKGPQDVLTVTYQLREYPSQEDVVAQVTNPHTDVQYEVVARTISGLHPARLRAWHGVGAVPGGNFSQARLFAAGDSLVPWDSPFEYLPTTPARVSNSRTVAPYSPGSFYRESTDTFTESDGNVPGGISRMIMGNLMNPPQSYNQPFLLQASFDPPIDKDNTKTLIITLRRSWGRHEP